MLHRSGSQSAASVQKLLRELAFLTVQTQLEPNRKAPLCISFIDAFWQQVRSRGDCVALVVTTPQGSKIEVTWWSLAEMTVSAVEQCDVFFSRNPNIPRHIGHVSDNAIADVVIALVSMSMGAVEFPFECRLSADERKRRWQRVGGLWLDQTWRERIGRVPDKRGELGEQMGSQPADLDAPSLVLWTSGTTGTARGVTLSSRNLCGNATAKLGAVPQSQDDVRLCVLPLSHAYARTCDLGTWLLSGCVLALASGYEGLKQVAPLVHPTLINVVPSLANRMLADPSLTGLERLRLLGCGGAAMNPLAFQQWQRRGVTVIQGYGLTEASPVICSASPDNARPGCVGPFVAGWESKIENQQLLVRGPHVMLGYWKDPEATARQIDREGWLKTGDQIERDPESGQIRILGRLDDVLVLDSGRKIHPANVEHAVERIQGVSHAILVRRNRLELWFEGDPLADIDCLRKAIRDLLNQIAGLSRCQVHAFDSPLCEKLGELTHKGAICRDRILQNRFSD